MIRTALLLSWLAALTACRVEDAPQRPIDDHVAMCCKAGASDPLSFTGCRPSNHCRTAETVWVRGPIECGPVEESRCQGGRCCSLDVSTPIVPGREPPIEESPIEPVYVPEPALIEPMSFESQ